MLTIIGPEPKQDNGRIHSRVQSCPKDIPQAGNLGGKVVKRRSRMEGRLGQKYALGYHIAIELYVRAIFKCPLNPLEEVSLAIFT